MLVLSSAILVVLAARNVGGDVGRGDGVANEAGMERGWIGNGQWRVDSEGMEQRDERHTRMTLVPPFLAQLKGRRWSQEWQETEKNCFVFRAKHPRTNASL